MKKIILLLLLTPMLAFAEAPFKQGTYWDITAVEVHPGKLDAYIENLNTLWRRQMDKLVEEKKVVSYKMLSNVHARKGEPDLWLMVEWTSAGGMMDLDEGYWEKMMSDTVGSREDGAKRNIEREELRSIMGSTLAREISFR